MFRKLSFRWLNIQIAPPPTPPSSGPLAPLHHLRTGWV